MKADNGLGWWLLGAGAVVGGGCGLLDMRRRRLEYESKYPPISDDEFLARTSQGVRPEVALKVREIIADCFGVEPEFIHPGTNLIELETSL